MLRKIILIDITMPPEQENDLFALKERFSAVTTDSKDSQKEPLHLDSLQTSPSIKALFQETSQIPSISSKVTKKSVNWLLAIAWSKDYSLETGWTALMLFYGYRAQKTIKKQTLEPLLLVCLQLATKIHETVPLKISELLLCCSSQVEIEILLEFEGELLELFDFQLCQTNMLERVAGSESLQEEQVMKVLFMAQLYLTRDVSILFDYSKCKRLMQMVRGADMSEGFELEVLEVQQMAFDPLNKTLINKFSSKFDVEQYLSQFQ